MSRILVLFSIFIATSFVSSFASEGCSGDIDSEMKLTATIDSLESEIKRDLDTLSVTLSGNAEIDSAEFARMGWMKQLYETGFRIHDPRINYPKAMRFFLKIYDWGDKTFNSYDPDYVVGSGKNWKGMVKNYNWMESYMMMFSIHTRDMLHIRSEIFNDLGFHLSFMAVSLGYTAKVNNWAGSQSSRSNFNFNFTSSRFSANIDILSTEGDTHITHFGQYNDGRSFNYKFDDIKHKSFSGEVYYFLNHLKYSQAAAYCFSKYQLKSAGSAIIGFALNNQRIYMDFSSLPEDMKKFLPSLDNLYRFRYCDYGLLAGYGHNWALKPRKWLLNLTAIPSVGFRHSYSDSSEGKKNMLAANVRLRFALVYNHKALFASLNGRFDGHLFFNSRYAFFNSTESVSMIVGARF